MTLQYLLEEEMWKLDCVSLLISAEDDLMSAVFIWSAESASTLYVTLCRVCSEWLWRSPGAWSSSSSSSPPSLSSSSRCSLSSLVSYNFHVSMMIIIRRNLWIRAKIILWSIKKETFPEVQVDIYYISIIYSFIYMSSWKRWTFRFWKKFPYLSKFVMSSED